MRLDALEVLQETLHHSHELPALGRMTLGRSAIARVRRLTRSRVKSRGVSLKR